MATNGAFQRFGSIIWRAVAVSVLITGCRTIPNAEPAAQQAAEVPTISVSGAVAQPKTVELRNSSISIREAINRAGGIAAVPGGLIPKEAFVVLDRRTGMQRESYYIPLTFVQNTIAGEIQARGGDSVRLMNWQETTLGPQFRQNGEPNTSVEVTGRVRNPSTYITTVPNAAQPMSQIGDVANAAGQLLPNEGPANIVILHRTAPSGMVVEHFLLPLDDSEYKPLANREMVDAWIVRGDAFEFARLETFPLVLLGAIRPAIEERVSRRVEKERRLLRRNRENQTGRVGDAANFVRERFASLGERFSNLR